MDFMLALIVSGIVGSIILMVSLGIYAHTYRRIKDRISSPVRRSLIFFAAASLMVVFLGFTAASLPQYAHIWMGLFLAFVINAEIQILAEARKTHRITLIVSLIIVLLIALISVFTPVAGRIYFLSLQYLLLAGAGLLGIRLVYLSPSPFSISLMALLASFMFTWYSGQDGGIILAHPEYFIIMILPMVVSSALLASIGRPPRAIITLAIAFFAIIVSASLVFSSILSNEPYIYSYVLAATFAGLCALYPLNYFLEQGTLTKARTPFFVASTLIAISLLVITHSNAWAIAWNRANTLSLPIDADVWDPDFLFLNWVQGVLAVFSFLLAGISLGAREKVLDAALDTMLFAAALLIPLGHPFIRLDRYDLALLYIPLGVFILIASGVFIKISYNLAKGQSTRIALRFLLFMFAALGIGLAAMFSDVMYVIWEPLVVIMVILAGLALLVSSPARPRILRSRTQRSARAYSEVD